VSRGAEGRGDDRWKSRGEHVGVLGTGKNSNRLANTSRRKT